MGKDNLNFFKIILCFLFLPLFFSCAQNLPEIKIAVPTIIFDYEAQDSLPKGRLSIFVESVSDVRRYESISIKSIQTNYIWDTDEIVMFKNSDKMYAGYTNFIVPEGELIPSGEYQICYMNADGEEQTLNINLNYDSEFYQKTASEIPDFFKTKRGSVSLMIFNANKNVLYFGDKKDDLNNSRKIWNKYRDAAFYQEIWTTTDNSVMCVLPLTEVVPE